MSKGKPKPIDRRRERHGKAHVAVRLLVMWIVNAIGLWVGAAFVPGVTLESFGWALVAAAVLGALNALLWPALIRFALPLTAWTLGLGALFLNGLVVWLAAEIIGHGFDVDRVWQGVLLAVWLSVVSIVITTVLSVDDDAVVYRSVVKRQMRKTGAIESDVPGVLFLEIDGLGHEVLTRAMRDGNAPNLARWVQDGSHHLVSWETDWSSQTGAAQTGLLLGSNENIPAFRWWDKEQGRAVASSAPKDVLAIEASLSTGKGLLHADGASRSNMYSGDAVHSSLTIATLRQQERHHERRGQGYLAYFSNPFAMVRTIVLMIGGHDQGALERRRADAPRRLAARPPRVRLLASAGVHGRRSARSGDVRRDRRHLRRHGRSSTRRSPATTRSPITPGSSGPTRWPSSATSTRRSIGSRARRTTRRVRSTSSSSPTTARARGRRSSSATARRSRRSSPRRPGRRSSRARWETRG